MSCLVSSSAVEKAVLYIETGQLPSTWDFNLLKSRDRGDGESEGTESSDESSDDEYDEQKDAWLASLHKFMEERSKMMSGLISSVGN